MVTKTSPRRMLAQPYDYSVQDVVDKIKSRDIDLAPDYQRNYVWEKGDEVENKCSRLIESLLLNIPIPVIYFAEQAETLKYEVIDGQQRLRTFQRYLDDDFPLKGLEIRDDVNGKKYSELEVKDRDEIRKRSIRAIVILNESDEEVKYEVFERLNLGSIQLTNQEIRNSSLRGDFNNLLKELAKNSQFKEMLHLRLKSSEKNMAREELVLRFFAYHDSGYKQVKNLSYFLTDYMKKNQHPSPETLNNLRGLFLNTIDLVFKYLKDKAFSNFIEERGCWASLSNKSLYDAEMLAFSHFIGKEIKVTPEDFPGELQKLMGDKDFKSLHTQASSEMRKRRVSAIKAIIAGENL